MHIYWCSSAKCFDYVRTFSLQVKNVLLQKKKGFFVVSCKSGDKTFVWFLVWPFHCVYWVDYWVLNIYQRTPNKNRVENLREMYTYGIHSFLPSSCSLPYLTLCAKIRKSAISLLHSEIPHKSTKLLSEAKPFLDLAPQKPIKHYVNKYFCQWWILYLPDFVSCLQH